MSRVPSHLPLVAAALSVLLGCSSTAPDAENENVAQSSAAVDTICSEAPSASIDGIPAYAYCGNFNVFSNNGVDTRSYGGPGWVQTEAGYGYQCFELAARYMHFKWGISANWGVLYASEMCTVHPPGVTVTTTPVHGDLVVFPGGRCGVAAPAGHVAVVDTVGATSYRAVQQNVATELTWPFGCESCFLHAASNGGTADPCAISNLTGYACGASAQFPSGTKDTLYHCVAGVTADKTACANGCSVQPAGVDDRCNDPPPPPEVFPAITRSSAADVNGDGRGDVCARGAAGERCALGTASGLAADTVWSADFANDKGWEGEVYASSVQLADVDGDGKADLCGRNSAGIMCALSLGDRFGAPVAGPGWSDAAAWNRPEYATTIQFGDVDGDGKADVCGRDSAGISCALAIGGGRFGAAVRGPDWSDGGGWNAPVYYSTIQLADVNGDGKADVCARDSGGVVCGLSNGKDLRTLVRGPAWSDKGNWNHPQYASTMRFVDVNGDGKADVCARSAAGIACSLSTGTGFGPELAGPAWSDASGWNGAPYYLTIRFADVDGDGKADVCGRGAAGVTCELSDGRGFPAEVKGPAWSDASGFAEPRFYTTFGALDVDADGRDDLCIRTNANVTCALSKGTAFADAFAGPPWSDASGWGAAPYFGSIRYAGAAKRPHASGPSGGVAPTGGGSEGVVSPAVTSPDAPAADGDGGCSIARARATDGTRAGTLTLLVVALAAIRGRRRTRTTPSGTAARAR